MFVLVLVLLQRGYVYQWKADKFNVGNKYRCKMNLFNFNGSFLKLW